MLSGSSGSVLLQADSEDSDQSSPGAQSRIHRNRNRGYMEETYRQHIFMIFIQMKELKKFSLPRHYKTMSENA